MGGRGFVHLYMCLLNNQIVSVFVCMHMCVCVVDGGGGERDVSADTNKMRCWSETDDTVGR